MQKNSKYFPTILPILIFNILQNLHLHRLSEDEIDLIKNTALFDQTPPEQFNTMLSFSTLVKYSKNTLIFKEGALADAFYIIAEGSVRVFTYDKAGKKIPIARLNKGDYFGEQAIISQGLKTRNASIETIEDTALIRIIAKSVYPLWEKDKNLLKKLKKIGFEQALQFIEATNQNYGDIKDILQQMEVGKLNILELSNGASVFNFGDKPDKVYLILQGTIELQFPNNKAQIRVSQGHLFGELAIIENKPRRASAIAIGNVRLLVIHGDEFGKIYRKNSRLQHLLSIYKKTYQLPLIGIVEQYIGETPEVGPTITSIYKLQDGRSIIATRSIYQGLFTMLLMNAPNSVSYKYSRASQNLAKIAIYNNHLVGIESYGEWDDLPIACQMMLDNKTITDSILEQFPATGKLEIMLTPKAEVICTCMSVSRDQIMAFVSQGIIDFPSISKETGAGTVCGSCQYKILEILGENPWMSAQMQRTIKHNSYIQSYLIKLIDRQLNRFEAGQHILVKAKINDNWIERCYTISDIQQENGLRITIKKEEKGLFTQWLFTSPDQFDVLITQPQGAFTLPADEDTPIICFAGGIGITPFISYAKQLLVSNSNKKLHILYCALTNKDFIFTEEFNAIVQSKSSITIDYRDTETHGLLTKNEVIDLVKSKRDPAIYICGPEGFVNMVNKTLEEINYNPNKIFIEKFVHAGG